MRKPRLVAEAFEPTDCGARRRGGPADLAGELAVTLRRLDESWARARPPHPPERPGALAGGQDLFDRSGRSRPKRLENPPLHGRVEASLVPEESPNLPSGALVLLRELALKGDPLLGDPDQADEPTVALIQPRGRPGSAVDPPSCRQELPPGVLPVVPGTQPLLEPLTPEARPEPTSWHGVPAIGDNDLPGPSPCGSEPGPIEGQPRLGLGPRASPRDRRPQVPRREPLPVRPSSRGGPRRNLPPEPGGHRQARHGRRERSAEPLQRPPAEGPPRASQGLTAACARG